MIKTHRPGRRRGSLCRVRTYRISHGGLRAHWAWQLVSPNAGIVMWGRTYGTRERAAAIAEQRKPEANEWLEGVRQCRIF